MPRARIPALQQLPHGYGEPDVSAPGSHAHRQGDPKPAELPHSDIVTNLLLGTADRMAGGIDDIREVMARAWEYGAMGDPERLSWTAAKGYADGADYSVVAPFRSIAVINDNPIDSLYVSDLPGGGKDAIQSIITLPPLSFVVLPLRSNIISVGTGTTAGAATVIPFTTPMPFAAGSLFTAGSLGASTANVTIVGNSIVSTKTPLTAAAPTAATVGVASASAVGANAARTGLVLINTSTAWISLGFGAPAVLYNGITLQPNGGSFEMDEGTFSLAGVFAIASLAASNLGVQEYT